MKRPGRYACKDCEALEESRPISLLPGLDPRKHELHQWPVCLLGLSLRHSLVGTC